MFIKMLGIMPGIYIQIFQYLDGDLNTVITKILERIL